MSDLSKMKRSNIIRLNYHQIAFVFLAFTLMVAAAYFSVGNILRDRLFNQAYETISTVEANISSNLVGAETILLNSTHYVHTMLEQNIPARDILDFLTSTTDWMRQQDRGFFDFYGIYGYINGEFYDGIGLNPGDDYIPQTRPWYRTAAISGSNVGYTAPYTDWRTGDTVVSAVKNIIDNNGNVEGILVIDINIRQLLDYVRSLASASGGYGTLVSQNMTIMTYPDDTLTGTRLDELGGTYNEIAGALRSGGKVLGQRINDFYIGSSIVFFTGIFNGWYLGIITPYHMFFRDIYIMGIMLSALGLFLSLLLCYPLLRISAARIRAVEESKSKSSFLANMSHEIRTPMNAVTGMAELLLREDLSSEAREYAQEIKQAGNNLISIINDILDFSKIEAGKLEIVPVNYNLASLLNDTVNIVRMQLMDKPVHFNVNIDQTIPNNLTGDEGRLRQILLNILSNAVKYTKEGSIYFSITCDKQEENEIWIKIAVTDTGVGIKPEDVKNLFTDYAKVDTKRNRSIEGTGLGLAITKRLCIAMGGDISVQSEYGKGSTFTVIIPQGINSSLNIEAAEVSANENNENRPETKYTFPDARILVVDDLPTNIKVAEGLLAPYEAKVDACLSGKEAIEMVKQNKYDIIFMDHMMPEMDGIETTEHIRAIEKDIIKRIPIVALTADTTAETKNMLINKGFNDFLAKPINVDDLYEILIWWIGKKNRNKEKQNKDQKKESKEQLPKETPNPHLYRRRASDLQETKSHTVSSINNTGRQRANKTFMIFSCILFAIIFTIAFSAYSISARQINKTHIEQQLAIASETMRLRLATTVNSELSLVLKMADTPVIRQHFLNPADAELKALAHAEFELYEQHFKDKIVFWVNDIDKIFYSIGHEPYIVDPDDPDSYWYNLTLYNTEKHNLNINFNADLNQINLWVNVPVFAETDENTLKPIGMLGTGIDLTEFSEFVASGYREFDRNITPYMFNKYNEITSAKDYGLVHNKVRLDEHLGSAGVELVRAARSLPDEGSISFIYGKNIYLLSSISTLEWYLSVSYPLPGLLSLNEEMNMVFFNMIFLILLMFLVINIFISRSENAITEQNIQLIEANRKAQAASQAKSDFLAKMSHELRTPMNAITGMNEMILRNEIPDEVRSHAQEIKLAISNLSSIINDILDFSKIEANKLEISPVKYLLSSLVNDVQSIIKIKLLDKPIQFTVNIDGGIPNGLIGDEVRLRQILLNLLSNAVKFTEHGYISLTVTQERIEEEKIWLKAVISDTGCGIKTEDQARLLVNTKQPDNDKNDIAENGLGLAIAKQLCEAMGGSISVQSEYGKGSIFTVIIPQGFYSPEKFASAENYANNNTENIAIKHVFPDARILLVDDIPANLKVAEGLLAPYKVKVDMCLSGAQAIELVKQNEYDLVFMDHMMPEMDGMETVANIRSFNRHLPIAALTANAVVGMRERFLENGFNDFLAKPIDITKLDEILNNWITKKVLNDEPETKTEEDKNQSLSIPNVDVQRGIAGTGGIKNYLKVLSVFCKDAQERLSLFETIIKTFPQGANTDTLRKFTTQAHALKSSTATIGALDVSVVAASLEEAGNTGNLEIIKEKLPSFTEQVSALIEDIRAALDQQAEQHSPVIDISSCRQMLSDLESALKSKNAAEIDRILEELNQIQTDSKTKEILDKVSGEVLVAEYDKALEILEEIS